MLILAVTGEAFSRLRVLTGLDTVLPCGVQYRRALNFCETLIVGMSDFLCCGELIFAIGKDCFFLFGINFCDFKEVAFH